MTKAYTCDRGTHPFRDQLTLCESGTTYCQEIGLVTIMFFFELLFPYVSSSISFYVPFTNLFSIILSPYLLITRDMQDEGEARFDSTSTRTV